MQPIQVGPACAFLTITCSPITSHYVVILCTLLWLADKMLGGLTYLDPADGVWFKGGSPEKGQTSYVYWCACILNTYFYGFF